MEPRKYPYTKIGEPHIDDLLDRVEEALGFQLFIWQRQYIWTGDNCWVGGRWTGKTTAHILRTLLIFKEEDGPLDMTRPLTARERLYKEEMKAINQKLDYFRIPTREVWYNIEYKSIRQEKKTKRQAIGIDVIDLFPNVINKITQQMQIAENDIVYYKLKEYGITKDNLVNNMQRVQVFSLYPANTENNCLKKRFLIDGFYAFTVCYKTTLDSDGYMLKGDVWIEEEENV